MNRAASSPPAVCVADGQRPPHCSYGLQEGAYNRPPGARPRSWDQVPRGGITLKTAVRLGATCTLGEQKRPCSTAPDPVLALSAIYLQSFYLSGDQSIFSKNLRSVYYIHSTGH